MYLYSSTQRILASAAATGLSPDERVSSPSRHACTLTLAPDSLLSLVLLLESATQCTFQVCPVPDPPMMRVNSGTQSWLTLVLSVTGGSPTSVKQYLGARAVVLASGNPSYLTCRHRMQTRSANFSLAESLASPWCVLICVHNPDRPCCKVLNTLRL